MADGLVLTRRLSERGVHETAQRPGGGTGAAVVRHYVGYEEWAESGFLRREVARRGVALILAECAQRKGPADRDAASCQEGSVQEIATRNEVGHPSASLTRSILSAFSRDVTDVP